LAAVDWEREAPASASQVLVDALAQSPRRRQAILEQLLTDPAVPPQTECADVFAELETILACR
jgi:hypothetical protein